MEPDPENGATDVVDFTEQNHLPSTYNEKHGSLRYSNLIQVKEREPISGFSVYGSPLRAMERGPAHNEFTGRSIRLKRLTWRYRVTFKRSSIFTSTQAWIRCVFLLDKAPIENGIVAGPSPKLIWRWDSTESLNPALWVRQWEGSERFEILKDEVICLNSQCGGSVGDDVIGVVANFGGKTIWRQHSWEFDDVLTMVQHTATFSHAENLQSYVFLMPSATNASKMLVTSMVSCMWQCK